MRFFLVFVFIQFYPCHSQKSSLDAWSTTFAKFPVNKSIELEEFFSISDFSVDRFNIYNDSLLVIKIANESNNLIKYDLVTQKAIGEFVKSGRKSDEVLGFMRYDYYANDIWIYDIVKSGLMIYKYSTLYDSSFKQSRFYKLPDNYYDVQLLDSNTLLTSGNYNSPYWLEEINLLSGTVEKQYVPYSETWPDQSVTKAEKTAYESFLYVKPDKSKAVLAARYADRIQLVNLSDGSYKVIKGPENFDPDLIVMKGYDNANISARGNDTRYAFVRGKTTNEYIYLLYSGNNHEGINRSYGKYIYKYDWDGNPIERLELPEYSRDFAVTSDDRIIYTYDPKDKMIKTGKLDLD